MSANPERCLISAVLRSRDRETVIANPIPASMFATHSAEWDWMTRFLAKYQKVPSRVAFIKAFPDFSVIRADDVGHFIDEVRQSFARRTLVSSMRSAAGMLNEGNLDKAIMSMQRSLVETAQHMGTIQDTDIIREGEDVGKVIKSYSDRVIRTGSTGFPTGFDTWDDITGGVKPGELTVVAARLGQGKALDNSTPVATPTGWTPIGDLSPGDHVIGSDGAPTKVVSVHPQGLRVVHEVRFRDGTTTRACEDHLWTTRVGTKPWKTSTTSELAAHLADGRQRPAVPCLSAPIEYAPSAALTYPPYLLGLLLGDGCFRSKGQVTFTAVTDKVLVSAFGEAVTGSWADEKTYPVRGARAHMVELGLWGHLSKEKFIPRQYLLTSPSDRLALLQGLMDTDGSPYVNSVDYSTSSHQLALDVRELAESLGGYATLAERTTRCQTGEFMSYRMKIRLPVGVVPFRLERKLSKWVPPTYQPDRTIVSITATSESVPMTCIVVDAPDALFTIEHGIVTHNSWVMLRMAVAAILAGHTVLYDSLEMSRAHVALRAQTLLATQIGADFRASDMLNGSKAPDMEGHAELVRRISSQVAGSLHVSDTSRGRVSPLTINGQIERIKPDIVFVDYLTLLEKSGDGDWRSISALSKDLHGMAQEHNVAMVTASQLNRSMGVTRGNSMPGLDALAESDAVGQDADQVMVLVQRSKRVLKQKLAKNRYGPGGATWWTEFRPGDGVIREVDPATGQDLMNEDEQNEANR